MSYDYLNNGFIKGIVSDNAPQFQNEQTVRDAVNMDFAQLGNTVSFTPVSGTVSLYNIGGSENTRIIGAFPCNGKINGVITQGFIIFAKGLLGDADAIYFHSVTTEYYTQLFIGDLGFVEESTVNGFGFIELSRPKFYFVDGNNEPRCVVVDDNYTNTIETLSVFNKAVTNPYINNNIQFESLIDGGQLLSGTYQFAIRYYNRANYKYSAWGLFTYPIPAIAKVSEFTYGGMVGVSTGKAIRLSLYTATAEGYDSAQVAVLKNISGDSEVSTVAYTLPLFEITNTIVQFYDYTGMQPETEIPLSEIVVDPANVKAAKSWTQKNNKAILGNIEYNDRRIADNECTFMVAQTQIQATNLDTYSDGSVPYRHGHFRDELYRYGVTCMDDNGIWSQVKPLDLSKNSLGYSLYRLSNIDPFEGTPLPFYTIASQSYDSVSETITVTITGINAVSNFPVGQLVRIDKGGGIFPYYVVQSIFSTNTLVTLANSPTAPISYVGGTISVCLGDQYNQSESIDWRYPARSIPYGALIYDNQAQNLGLYLGGVANFPSWAKAFAIVRRPRLKNILGQTPHIPLSAYQGVVTPGKNVVNNNDYNPVDDTLAPKIFRLGGACNLAWYERQLNDADGGSSTQTIQQIAWIRQQAGVEDGTNASPQAALLAHPDYIFNNNGQPYGGYDINKNAFLRPVDMVAFTLNARRATPEGLWFNIADGSNWNKQVIIFQARDSSNYFYQRNGYQYQKRYGGSWVNVPYANLLTTAPMALAGIQSQYPILQTIDLVNGNAVQVLPFSAFPLSDQLQNVIRYGGQTDLSQQQVSSGINQIPAAQRILFGNQVQVQRGIVAQLGLTLPDPSAIVATQETGLLFKMFSRAGRTATANMDSTTFLNINLASRWGTSDPAYNIIPTAVNVVTAATVPSDQYAGYAMIMNIEAGLGDDRYGDPESAQTWQMASGVIPIIGGTTSYNVDVWGGDCFIARAVYKLNNGINRPVIYSTVDGSLGLDFSTGLVAKTGSQTDMVEVLDLYVESEVDARYQGEGNRYPVVSSSIANFDQTWTYAYNGGYSAQENQKVFANPDLRNPVNNKFPARMLISDQKVYQSNIEGFNIYRANSFYDLDEQYGAITVLLKRTDDVLLAVQEFAVRIIPIQENVLTQYDGSPIGVSTTSYIAENVVRYLTTQYGCQHIRAVISTEVGVAMIDARSRAFLLMYDDVKLLSANGVQNLFNSFLDTNDKIPQSKLAVWYDSKLKELHICMIGWLDSVYNGGNYIGQTRRSPFWLVYNTKFNAYKTRIDALGENENPTLWALSVAGELYQTIKYEEDIIGIRVGKMNLDKTSKGVILVDGTYKPSSFTSIFVGDPYVEKVFDIMLLNTNLPVDRIDLEAEFDGNNLIATGIVPDSTPRNGLYYVNNVRADESQARLRGKFLKAVFYFDGDSFYQQAIINGVSVKYRKSQRIL